MRIKKRVNRYFIGILYIGLIGVIVLSGNKSYSMSTTSTSGVRSLQTSQILKRNDNIEKIERVYNTKEIKAYGPKSKIEFTGTLTGYGPDCEGCLGMVYCSPYPNVQNGKIYYNDKEYGKLRIVAADYSIPCGSIVRIDNFKFNKNEPLYAIVLDRGSAIVGLTMDLLYPSEADTNIIGRNYNINFTIERWGW